MTRAWVFRPDPASTHVFVCGSPAMIDDVVALLGRDGFREHTRKQPGQVHVGRFW